MAKIMYMYYYNNKLLEKEQQELIQEATELMKIFSSIMRKSE